MTQLVEKAVFGFFDKLLTFSISSKKFLTARESGGSPVSVWLRPKASGLPPAAPTPFHTFPPWLILRGTTFSTSWVYWVHRVAAGKKFFPLSQKGPPGRYILQKDLHRGGGEGRVRHDGTRKESSPDRGGPGGHRGGGAAVLGGLDPGGPGPEPDRSPRSDAGQRLPGPVRPALARFCLTGEKVHVTILFKHKGVVGAATA